MLQLLVSLGVLLVVYTWVGYPCLLYAAWRIGRIIPKSASQVVGTARGSAGEGLCPTVSIIIAAYNEEPRIRAKLENCQRLLYPPDKIEILVASDGSTDQTGSIVEELAGRDPRIHLLRSPGRAGKSGVQNLAVQYARGEILFFTDANARVKPDVLQLFVASLADSRAGLVSAEVFFGTSEDAVSRGQGFYWQFEFFLRRLESDLGILSTASGPAFAVRSELFRPLPACYGDDCITPLDVRLQRYRVLHDPRAIVVDTLPHSIQGELRARIRMTARNWSGTLARPAILNPMRFPLTALGLVSHKLLRWLTPLFLGVIFLSSTLLALEGRDVALWWLQLTFYLSAFVGWELTRKQRPAGWFGYSFSFCLANVGFLLGLLKALRNQKIEAY